MYLGNLGDNLLTGQSMPDEPHDAFMSRDTMPPVRWLSNLDSRPVPDDKVDH
jgi:hypothetical protein